MYKVIHFEVLKALREEMTSSESDVATRRGRLFSFLCWLDSKTDNRVSEWAAGSSWGMNAIKGCL